ncbi:hypothetical protein Ppa06_64580 [Planomonospora parontospora subsp. parontospora]|uniref:Uncharacterized protein n=2 Tax=Planomonospora parontospora TaxID=58119 RepID=A0AA37BMN1_9ACTN|nr:SsgA family sporulation/cell division regulator [Planomonospora parontospora]GGK94245.1 hypothetical protein GCM10010126_62040 [Planomonospora parontospora]GII12660.1 hypothetical protein Ppa06_64580 [Planomonospora parontospora subsp. parontospora]
MIPTDISGREIVEGLMLWPATGPGPHQMVVLTYRPDRPYEVRLTFLSPHLVAVATVVCAREVLIDGLLASDADADPEIDADGPVLVGNRLIQVGRGPSPDRVLLRVCAGGAWLDFHADRARLQAVVDDTLQLVSMGRERDLLDVDGAIAAIFSEVTP